MEARGLGSSPICWLIDWQLTSSDLPLSLSLVAVYTADGQGKTPRGNEEREREKRGRLECSMATACRNVFPFLNKSRGTYIYIYIVVFYLFLSTLWIAELCARPFRSSGGVGASGTERSDRRYILLPLSFADLWAPRRFFFFFCSVFLSVRLINQSAIQSSQSERVHLFSLFFLFSRKETARKIQK